MVASKITTTDVSKNEYTEYQKKGRQFFNVMKICLQDGEWDAVLLNGVHAAISLADALAIFRLGKRSTSKAHQDAAGLLSQALPSEEGRKNAARLAEILNYKHPVEYEARRFTEDEARRFAQKVERLILWIEKQLP